MAAMLLAVSCKKIATKEEAPADLPMQASNGTLPGDDPLIGYATLNGGTTGGAGGTNDTVTTYSALKSAAESYTTRKIFVSGNISNSSDPSPIIYVKSNKSIIGLPGSSLSGICLFMNAENEDISNVIIQNMKMSNTIGRSCVSIKDSTENVWIDHNEFWTDRSHGWDYWDGLCDVTGRSKNVTISWNKFHDSHIPVLIGNGESNTGDTVMRVTVHHNYFIDCSERMPRVAYAKVHVFNNYMYGGTTSAAGYAVASTKGAVVRTDNNYFENITIPIRTDISADPGSGYISGESTNYYAPDCGSNSITTTASTWVPTEYSYSSYLTSASQAKTDVMAGAGVFATAVAPSITTQPSSGLFSIGTGATLSVTATGTATLTYQWKKNGTNISGATSSTLTTSSIQPSDEGSYTVVVTNSAGSVTSNAAVVKVNLLQNNGFENDLTSWTKTYGVNPLINTNLSHVHSGAKSLISGPASGEGRGQYINSGFTVGASYTIATWGKVSTSSPGAVEIEIQYFNSGGTRISKLMGATPNSTTFAQSSFSSTIPSGTTSILILVWNNGGKTFYSDDWSYTKD